MALGMWLLPGAAALASEPGLLARSGGHEHAPGYLGIDFHDMSDEQVAALHLPGSRGVEVLMVDHDGPAGKAGVQPHDVLLQMDGKNLENAEDLRRRIRESGPGRVIQLTVTRGGRTMQLSAKLADRETLERDSWQQHLTVPQTPADAPEAIVVESYTTEQVVTPGPRASSHGNSFLSSVLRSGPYIGVDLDSIEPQLAQYFGAQPNSGLLVHGVDRNSPAANAGLRAGDVVLKVDAAGVGTTSEWTRRVKAANGRPVGLTILRDKREMTLTLQTDARKHSLLEWPRLFTFR